MIPDCPKYFLCKLFMFFALCECLIILICQFVGKDTLLYLHLHGMNLAIYLPNNRNQSKTPSIKLRSDPEKFWSDEDVLESRANSTWLQNNPVYKQFDIKESKVKKRVSVLIIVSSGPRRIDRRQAIRETWWAECKLVNQVLPECIFLTDHQNPADQYYKMLQIENEKYGDLRYQHVEGGITFGLRMLNHMVFALSNYEFDYFLRMDDDYFFCLENFLREVRLPMIKGYHWGWVHCIPTITRPEESMIMFSHDVIENFILQDPDKILCHPWADQMIGSWSNILDMTYLFRHDNRIHHTPIVSEQPDLREVTEVCKLYIAVHGTYPKDMRLFWSHRGPRISEQIPLKDLFRNSEVCPIRAPFDWKVFTFIWQYEPKPCITSPKWNTTKQLVLGGSYSGREEENKRPPESE